MQFKNLEDKCLYYRSLSDYKLLPNSYVLVMLDGRSFSHLVKNKFQKPFDDDFIEMMNETAKYVCKNVQGCKFAYVQSDEISLVLTDFDTPTTDAFFSNRLCKMQSIIASLATAKFNQLMLAYQFEKISYDAGDLAMFSPNDMIKKIESSQLYQFDCKCWNVPTYNDVMAWLIYRQNDCLKNSKQQTAQTYLPHKELSGKNTDEQIALLKEIKNIDWHQFPKKYKYGRFIWKDVVTLTNNVGMPFERRVWETHDGYPLTDEYYRNIFNSLELFSKLS